MNTSSSDLAEWSQEDIASEDDTDFLMIKCVDCHKAAIGKSMSHCSKCKWFVCQPCRDKDASVGCGKRYKKICVRCLEEANGKRSYCSKPKCDCQNRKPSSRDNSPKRVE